MKLEDPEDHELHTLFQRLRDAAPEAPAFKDVIAAAERRKIRRAPSPLTWLPAPLAAAAAIGMAVFLRPAPEPGPASLADWPVLLPPTGAEAGFLSWSTDSRQPMPSDRFLPPHLQFRL